MPRRVIHRANRYAYRGQKYRINVTAGSGVIRNIMDSICDELTYAASRGRWSLLHIRYVLEDGATNRMLLDQLRIKLGKYMRALWVVEESKQDDERLHYHLMLLVDSREKNMSRIKYLMMEIKVKGIIRSYRRMPPDLTRIPSDLKHSINMTDVGNAASRYGLVIKNMSALRFAIYWTSYLAKEHTKPKTSQRYFGKTKLPIGWDDVVQKEFAFEEESANT